MELHIKFILLCGYVDFVILRQILFKDSPLMRQRRSLLNLNFNDPDFTDPDWITQWYLNGQTTNMNIISAWKKGYTGRGVVITVIDKGVEMNHPEFGTRFNKNASFNFVENNTDPTAPIPPGTTGQARAVLSHGTNVAGLAAAEANNSKCGVGVAYECSIGGIRIHLRTDNNPASNDAEAKALKYRSNITDIYACAWGPPDHGGGIGRLKPKSKVSIYNTITYGREGKGGIFVFPAGNGGRMSDSCSYDEYVNSIYTIAVTAVSNKGKRLSLNEACTAIITTVYSRDGTKSPSEPDDGMATADVNGACTKSIDGTSAATGVSAGMIALMLQANPALTWRDAQHLIIHSSYPTLDDLWQTNGYGLKVSNYFGFGLLDALSMVNNAVNWTRVPQQKKCEFMVDLPDRPFNYSHPLKQIIDISNWPSRCGRKANRIKYLEHVVVTLNLRLASRTDLEVELTSPSGTKSLLIRPRGMLDQYYSKLKDFSVLSLHHWGENPTGRWTIEFRARNSRRSNQGMVFKWSITFFGTLTDPLSKNNITRRPSISTTAGGMVFNTTMTSTLSGNNTVKKTTISSPTQDIDECAAGIHNCDINAICTNNIGSFSCACNNGYSGIGTYCSANCLPPQTSETSRVPLYSSITITCVLFLILTAITVRFICKKRRTKVKEDRSAGSEIALGTINQASAAIYQDIAPLDYYQSLSPYRSSQLEFPRECLHLEGSIGSGQFGNVKLATIKGAWRMLEGKQVAIKELKENATDAERNTFLEELNLMKGLSPHQNMVTLLGCVTRSEPVYILVEYTPYGDLLGYLKSGVLQDNHYQNIDNINMNILTKNICILFAQDIANGMEFLASNQVVHRDLAGRNILVFDQSGRKTCKITDLGLSRSVYNTGIYVKTTAGRLPLKWMAPESIFQGEYSTKSDVWAYGIVLFEIFTKGETPYLGMSNVEVIERLKIGYKLKKPDNLDNEIYDIMLRCWCTSPTDRPTFTQLKSLFAYNCTMCLPPRNQATPW